MTVPVLIVHGVANRDRAKFENLASKLARDVGSVKSLPAYWGDIGAEVNGLSVTLPYGTGVRSADVSDATAAEFLLTALSDDARGSEDIVRASSAQRAAEIVADAAADTASESGLVRGTELEELRDQVAAAWPETQWLSVIDDEEVLKALGSSIAEAGGFGAGEPSDAAAVRGPSLEGTRAAVRGVVRGLDQAVGSISGRMGAQLNYYMREQFSPGLGAFLGDVFVYQRHREDIHARVWAALQVEDASLGTVERPVAVLGHSLGGVIAFDLAVAGTPRLYTRPLITFGSQSPFFHVLDPRGGDIEEFIPPQRTMLPPTISRWINLWEPLDPLAFVAARVFRLASRELPVDRPIAHLASYGLWTHSAYWRSAELVAATRDELRRIGSGAE